MRNEFLSAAVESPNALCAPQDAHAETFAPNRIKIPGRRQRIVELVKSVVLKSESLYLNLFNYENSDDQ